MSVFIFAFTAGMVASVNPCGFAMVPAYMSLFLTGGEGRPAPGGVVPGVRVGAWVTAGFVATFSVVGVVLTYVSRQIVDVLPWVALVVGVGLLALGIAVLAGLHLSARLPSMSFSKDGSRSSMALFGAAYGIASISCTLPVFLAVTTQVFAASNPVSGAIIFAAYGIGMGTVLIAIAVSMSTSREAIVRRARRVMPYVDRIGGWLLTFAGLYIVYYWAVNLSPGLPGGAWLAPIRAVDRISAWFTGSIADNTLAWVVALLALIAVVALFEISRATKSEQEEAADSPIRGSARDADNVQQ